MPWFQVVNYALILCLLILLGFGLWMQLFSYRKPSLWREAGRKAEIPKVLIRLEKWYPDKIRFYTWWFQVERLKREHIPGAFAELGVYKGGSARVLHAMDPYREFYLMDTFEGFPHLDLQNESGSAATYTTHNFKDTRPERVLRKIGGNDRIHLVKGYFPDSAKDLTGERFALVNLDADLYNPTKAGLEFFYPRMVPGGVMFIHDYSPKWPGVVRAADEFISNHNLVPVLIPDRDGTLVLIRS